VIRAMLIEPGMMLHQGAFNAVIVPEMVMVATHNNDAEKTLFAPAPPLLMIPFLSRIRETPEVL
jgi:hypothetical protein